MGLHRAGRGLTIVAGRGCVDGRIVDPAVNAVGVPDAALAKLGELVVVLDADHSVESVGLLPYVPVKENPLYIILKNGKRISSFHMVQFLDLMFKHVLADSQ